ncbi:MAG: Aspartate carbamoyltransferase [Methanonatronarchaeales archaeon]|nr:Aspartate carbamoyltransferase [Methanonatronarchaeales archaeon]
MLPGRDIISMMDLSREGIEEVVDLAGELEDERSGRLEGKLVALLFYEPSTRTRLSFEAASKMLGAETISIDSKEASSMAKGETLADTVRVVEGYCDLIVLRHPAEGSARMAAEFSGVPLINAGDGSNEHPTQTLLDLYTIWKWRGGLDGLTVTVAGDLRYGRTVHSLARALALFEDVTLTTVSPDNLRLPEDLVGQLDGLEVREGDDLEGAVESAEVLYLTRIQRERFADPEEYRKVAGSYRVMPELLEGRDLVLMHPLPRVDEISPEVDDMPQGRYFEQSANGVAVRKALLSLLLEDGDG